MDDLDRLYHRLLAAVRESAPHLRERRFRLGDIPQHLLPYRLHRRELGFESVQQYEGALARLAAGERGYLSAEPAVQQAFRRAVEAGEPLDQMLRQQGDALVALTPEGRQRPETPAGGEAAVSPAAAPTPGSPTPVSPTPAVPMPAAALPSAPAAAATASAVPAGASQPPSLVIPIVRVEEVAPDEVAIPVAQTKPAPSATPPAGPAATGTPAAGTPAAGTPAAGTPAAGTPAMGAPAAAPAPASPPVPAQAPSPAASAMPFPVRTPTPVVGGTCRNCGRPLPADRGVTFCPYCGENLTIRRCPACGTELEAEWRFCITCGREVDDVPPGNVPTRNTPALGTPAGGAEGAS